MRIRIGLAGCVLLVALAVPQISEAQSSDRQRAIRVGNRNVLSVGGGYREHDILVVGKTDAENITRFPYGPEHNIIAA